MTVSPEPKNGTEVMSQPIDDGVVLVEDVVVVRRSDVGWYCTIRGSTVLVSELQVAPGFLMPAEGQRGTIQLRAAALADLGLPEQSATRQRPLTTQYAERRN